MGVSIIRAIVFSGPLILGYHQIPRQASEPEGRV